MASLMESIMGQLGGDALKQIGGQIGTDERTAGTASGAAVATILEALSRNASNESGATSLSNALAKDHDGSILDNLQGLLSNPEQGNGQGILKHVLGGRQSAVEKNLGRSTGVDSASVGKLLMMVAPMVMGALGREQRNSGLDASSLAGLLGQERRNMEQKDPQAMGLFSRMLDTDGDGDTDMGDLAKHGMNLLGKFLSK